MLQPLLLPSRECISAKLESGATAKNPGIPIWNTGILTGNLIARPKPSPLFSLIHVISSYQGQ